MARVSIEDCQTKIRNRFVLSTVAANRARQLMTTSTPLVVAKNKEGVTALREIAEGLVVPRYSDIPAELEADPLLSDMGPTS